MGNSVKVTLGGVEYTVPQLNVGQLEDISNTRKPFDVLRIALRRAEPKLSLEQINDIEATKPEIDAAMDAIMAQSGVTKDASQGNLTAPPGGGA
jgi:hypothetical protein